MPSSRLNVPDLPPSQPRTKPFKPDGPRAAPLGGSLLEKISRWEVALSDYPESDLVEMVLSIIRNGATLGAPFALPRSYTPPYQSGPAEAFFLREEITRRLLAGKVVLPDRSSLVIHHWHHPSCSAAQRSSEVASYSRLRPLNGYVPPEFGTVHY